MLPTTRIGITQHALQRYRERVDATADRYDVGVRVRSSRMATKRERRQICQDCPGHRDKIHRGEFIFLVDGRRQTVFVLKIDGVGRYTLVTCFPKS